jgi:hypothetical protein
LGKALPAGDDGSAVVDAASVGAQAIRVFGVGRGFAQGCGLILLLLQVSVSEGDPEVAGFDGAGSANRSDCG